MKDIGNIDDRSLSTHGDDRRYWYSIQDVMTLLLNIRKTYFTFLNYKDHHLTQGEEYAALRPNDQKIFLADPYHESNFADYLSDDLDKIIGAVDTINQWPEIPDQIIIPLLAGAHWRLLRIQIYYEKKTRVSILFDDPYGTGFFPIKLKNKILSSIPEKINALVESKFRGCNFELSIEQVEKALDQQGIGKNSWDCGPIIVNNIVDYIKNYHVNNDQFQDYIYSIKAEKGLNHEARIIDVRSNHINQYREICGERPIITERMSSLLNYEIKASKKIIDSLNSLEHSYKKQINQLSPSKINMLFSLIETNRYGKESAEQYSNQEIREALDYINEHVTPILLEKHFEDEYFDVNNANKFLKKQKHEFNKLTFAIGPDDFAKITAQGKTFIDKSLLIKDIIETGDEVTIITRPRRWGKTTNMDMLTKFFSIQVDKKGNELQENSYRGLFLKLEIGQQYPELIEQNQGKYPVIFFTFKNIEFEEEDTLESQLIDEIEELYKQHKYLEFSNILDEDQKKQFKKYCKGKIKKKDLKKSFKILSSLLKEHYDQQVYIFIDEYDSLLNLTYNTNSYNKTLKLMRSMLGRALKGNADMLKSVVTGITKIAKAGLFSGLNNAREYSILESKYSQYFGFTEKEVISLLDLARIGDEGIKGEIKKYYNGYQIGDHTIYNPWSVVNFLTDFKLSTYWVNTESEVTGNRKLSTDFLMTDSMQQKVRELIKNCYEDNKKTVELIMNPQVTFNGLKDDPTAMWSILAFGGYLSVSDRQEHDDLTSTFSARIPNREILGIYKQSISFWFKEKISISLEDIQVLDIENITKFEEVVRVLLSQRTDIIGDANESLFHSFMDGLYLLKGGTTHLLSSEKIAGSGRIDSIFYPKKGRSEKIIIHEYKILSRSNTNSIDKKIQEALWQVYEHYYFKEVIEKYRELKYAHYKNIEIRGIVAFIDENTHQIGIRTEAITHDMKEMANILPAFENLHKDDLNKLKTHMIVDVLEEYKNVGSFANLLQEEDSSKMLIDNVGSVIHPVQKQILSKKRSKKITTISNVESIYSEEVGNKRAAETDEQNKITKKAKNRDLVLYENNLQLNHRDFKLIDNHDDISLILKGSIALLPETHDHHHLSALSLIDMINDQKIDSNTIICLERKTDDYHLSMQHVIEIAQQIKMGYIINEVTRSLPIYYDALLYIVASARGIKVIGVERKISEHLVSSLYYDIAREKYMAKQLRDIAISGAKAIYIVGSAHTEAIFSLVYDHNHNTIDYIKFDGHFSGHNIPYYTEKTSKHDLSLVQFNPTIPESNNQKSLGYNIELADLMLSIRDGIEFLPVFSYFMKEIVYPVTKGIIKPQLANIKLSELNPYVLVAAHLSASYIGAVALNVVSPMEAGLKASAAYVVRISSKEFMSSLSSVDLINNINMAGYCALNTALHFSSELLSLTGRMPKGNKEYVSLKAHSLHLLQKVTISTLECYNTYQKVHGNEGSKPVAKTDKVLPYVADGITALVSLGISYNPFFVIGNIVMTHMTSKLVLDSTHEDIKTTYIDPMLEYLGFVGDTADQDGY